MLNIYNDIEFQIFIDFCQLDGMNVDLKEKVFNVYLLYVLEIKLFFQCFEIFKDFFC